MNLPKTLVILLAVALGVWIVQVLCLLRENTNVSNRIRSQADNVRKKNELEYRRQLRDLENEYDRKKYLATGDTVFDRIFNTQKQTITDLIRRISDEAFPVGWSCEVKVEEFTHFLLLVFPPHSVRQPSFDQVCTSLQPVLHYCDWCLSDVAVFDGRHKCILFLDKSILQQLKSGQSLSRSMAELARERGGEFTAFNSVTVKCEKFGSHLYLHIEISGSNGVLKSCRAMLDTGADTTMIPAGIISQTGSDNLQTARQRRFHTVNGTFSCPVVRREVTVGGKSRSIEVAANLREEFCLLGMNYFDGMDYIVDFGKSTLFMWEK